MQDGFTPLMSAACQGHLALMQTVLTRKDVDLNAQSIVGGPGHHKVQKLTLISFAHMCALIDASCINNRAG